MDLSKKKKNKTRRQNYSLLQWERVPGSFHAAVVSFNKAFAVRLGATDAHIAWLTSFPALIKVLMRLPLARFLENRIRPLRWILGSLTVVRLMYIGPILIPILFPQEAGLALVIWLILMNLPRVIVQAGWTPMMLEIIHVRDRARIFANRQIIRSLVIFFGTLFFGQLLEWRADIFPANYQWLYVAGMCMLAVSTYLLLFKLDVPDNILSAGNGPDDANSQDAGDAEDDPDEEADPDFAPPFDTSWRATLSEMWKNRDYVNLTADLFIYKIGVWMLSPLWTIYFIDELNAGDGWIGLRLALNNFSAVIGYSLWRRVMDRKGFSWTLKRTVPFGAFMAIGAALVPDLTVIILLTILHRFFFVGFSLSRQNILYKLCPAEQRATYLGAFNTIVSVGQFIMPLVGVAVAGIIGIRATLLLGGCIRLFIGMPLFFINRFKEPEEDLTLTHSDAKGTNR